MLEIADPEYVPTVEDIVKTRVRTTGILEESYTVDGVDFVVYDVGGQRNERRKWIHAFDDVSYPRVFNTGRDVALKLFGVSSRTTRHCDSMQVAAIIFVASLSECSLQNSPASATPLFATSNRLCVQMIRRFTKTI